jgi:uncharacterized protein DUF5753
MPDSASGWWDRPLPGVPTEMGTLASYESDASSLTNWAVSLVPGLLQIEDYAMAVMLSQEVRTEVAELRWIARRRRQKILGTWWRPSGRTPCPADPNALKDAFATFNVAKASFSAFRRRGGSARSS